MGSQRRTEEKMGEWTDLLTDGGKSKMFFCLVLCECKFAEGRDKNTFPFTDMRKNDHLGMNKRGMQQKRGGKTMGKWRKELWQQPPCSGSQKPLSHWKGWTDGGCQLWQTGMNGMMGIWWPFGRIVWPSVIFTIQISDEKVSPTFVSAQLWGSGIKKKNNTRRTNQPTNKYTIVKQANGRNVDEGRGREGINNHPPSFVVLNFGEMGRGQCADFVECELKCDGMEWNGNGRG